MVFGCNNDVLSVSDTLDIVHLSGSHTEPYPWTDAQRPKTRLVPVCLSTAVMLASKIQTTRIRLVSVKITKRAVWFNPF